MLVEFCIPVLDEEAILRKNILHFFQFCNSREFDFDWRVTILLNGCSDNSLKIAEQLDQEFDRVTFFELQGKGKGKVLKEYGKASNSDIFFYMDIDLAVSLEHIPDFIDLLGNDLCDLAIGSRLLPGSKVDRSFLREAGSRGYAFFAGLLMRDGLKDRQCGFKAIRTEAFQKLLPLVDDDKWFFDTELLAEAYCGGWRIKEIPVNWEENRYDQRKSKIKTGRDSVYFLKRLIKLKIELNKNK